jgi:porphobilinogen synthase
VLNIYVKVSENLKDNTGKEAWNKDGLMQEAIRAIKAVCPEMIVMPDVALDPYSIWSRRYIKWRCSNDATNDALVKWRFSCRGWGRFCLHHLI